MGAQAKSSIRVWIGPFAEYRKAKNYNSLAAFFEPNNGCRFIPGFRYLLERYFVMPSMPETDVEFGSIYVLRVRSGILPPRCSGWPMISQKMLVG
jgi:hypothetical protein